MKLLRSIKNDFVYYRKLYPEQGFIGVLLSRNFIVCANYRFGHWACGLRGIVGSLMRVLYVLHDAVVTAITATGIRSGAIIGERFYIHNYFGIIITDGVVIGNDCTIMSGVCLVNKANGKNEGQPKIGNNVKLGIGCKVLGGVTVGDNVIVGANAVVIRDVPPNSIAVGVPAINKPIDRNALAATDNL